MRSGIRDRQRRHRRLRGEGLRGVTLTQHWFNLI